MPLSDHRRRESDQLVTPSLIAALASAAVNVINSSLWMASEMSHLAMHDLAIWHLAEASPASNFFAVISAAQIQMRSCTSKSLRRFSVACEMGRLLCAVLSGIAADEITGGWEAMEITIDDGHRRHVVMEE